MKWTEVVNLVAALLLSGWVASFIVQLIKRATWRSWVKLALAIVVSALVGLATAWVSGDLIGITAEWGSLTAADVLAFGGLVFASASTWYQFYFKGEAWAENLGKWPSK
jgi:hypothetical protein